ncbi:hypothetical protein [Devosia sp. RR2S18]|uniref:hypothetical protein n=1 Tax=Devosia rhizosphaerae TaxID=3049774 RepID=UPI0025422903|nr:hypothetical protein [Devosia sp. RR2S18]WIJ25784.1 hypothetical protein QOV41_03205 [Devosia sp. RR2S18]
MSLIPDYQNFVGFYWTFPVPSAGFTSLPKDVEEAARLSRTIRYQRQVVRHYVQSLRGTLVGELVFLELQPDRGTEHIEATLEKALSLCLKHNAQLLLVDFAQEGGWRSHPFMFRLMQRAPVSSLGLPPEPAMVDGEWFDPIVHFRRARKAASDRTAAARRREVLASRVSVLSSQHAGSQRFKVIAEQLNLEGTTTVNGRRWSEANVRAFLKKMSASDRQESPG